MIDATTPVIVGARRTPIGTAGLSLRDVAAVDLAHPVLRAVTDDALGADPSHVVLGNCMGAGGNVARVASLAAGFDLGVPAMTVDLQCGSGLAAVTTACALVRSGSFDTVVAGGVESASTAPWRSWPPVEGGEPQRYVRAPFSPREIGDPEMGDAADAVALAICHLWRAPAIARIAEAQVRRELALGRAHARSRAAERRLA